MGMEPGGKSLVEGLLQLPLMEVRPPGTTFQSFTVQFCDYKGALLQDRSALGLFFLSGAVKFLMWEVRLSSWQSNQIKQGKISFAQCSNFAGPSVGKQQNHPSIICRMAIVAPEDGVDFLGGGGVPKWLPWIFSLRAISL